MRRLARERARLEAAYRVVRDVADGAAPEARQPRQLRRLVARHQSAQRVPRIVAALEAHRAVALDHREATVDGLHAQIAVDADEAVARPLLAADRALEQIGRTAIPGARGRVREHRRQSIGEHLARHRQHGRTIGDERAQLFESRSVAHAAPA
jgi:hypothetical protein